MTDAGTYQKQHRHNTSLALFTDTSFNNCIPDGDLQTQDRQKCRESKIRHRDN